MTHNVVREQPLFQPERLNRMMDETGLDAIVAHSRRNFYYLSSFLSLDYVIDAESSNFVLIPRDPAVPSTVTIPASERLSTLDSGCWVPNKIYCGNFYIKDGPDLGGTTANSTWEGIITALRDGGFAAKRVGFELEQLPVSLYRDLVARFPKMTVVDASPLIRKCRVIKTPEEVRRIRTACEITEQSIQAAVTHLRPGMTENQLGNIIASNITAAGADVLYIQVSTGEAAGLGPPTERVIGKGDVVRMDIAATYQQYNSDLGRGCVVGPASAQQKENYRLSYQALQEGIAAVRPGNRAEQPFAAAMAVWQRAGYDHVRRHHVGHNIGLAAHEVPLLKPGVTDPIEPGMVIAVEVPYYVYKVGGFAPEDILLVGPDGNTLFTHAPAELPVAGEG